MDNVKNIIKALVSGVPVKSKILAADESWSTIEVWRKDDMMYTNEDSGEKCTLEELKQRIEADKNSAIRIAQDTLTSTHWCEGELFLLRIDTNKSIPLHAEPFSDEQTDRLFALLKLN